MLRLIKHPHRRSVALALLALGGLSFLLAPGNAGLILAGAGVALEILGVTLKHRDPGNEA